MVKTCRSVSAAMIAVDCVLPVVDTSMTVNALNILREIKRFRFTAAHFLRAHSANLHLSSNSGLYIGISTAINHSRCHTHETKGR